MTEKIEIDADDLIDRTNSCALIVCAPTGVWYTAQCGGLGCTHPTSEGFFLPVTDWAKSVDDCEMGCFALTKGDVYDSPDLRKALADAIDTEFRRHFGPYQSKWSFEVLFDYGRIDELMEGWWPVFVRGTVLGQVKLNHRAYFHRGNCD